MEQSVVFGNGSPKFDELHPQVEMKIPKMSNQSSDDVV